MPMSPRLLVPRATGIASPLVISGCIGWYDSLDLTAMAQNSDGTGAVAVGDQVGWWKDKSPTGANVTQGTAANRPTLTANKVGGRAALTFDGSNDNLASAAGYTAQNSLAGLTRILVLQNASVAAIATRVFNGGSDSLQTVSSEFRQYVNATANYTAFASIPGQSGNAMALGIYAFTYGNSAMGLRFNGATISGTVTGTIPATTGGASPTLHIGSNIGANNFFNGPIAEYIIYNRELSVSELARVEAFLKKKWGL
ncbi:MAG: LamG-like jellyroll fold domain-containing protein [Synechococcus sp.]|nr:LamG-like jellyroll fold domain-containing protein [Synechococcus sp.]